MKNNGWSASMKPIDRFSPIPIPYGPFATQEMDRDLEKMATVEVYR